MTRRLTALFAFLVLLAPLPAAADPADIDAAARGVVRVVIVEHEGDSVIAISHGTGFAVSPERVVTNSHVIQEAQANPNLFIGIVPSDGEEAVYARLISVSPRNDLALIATTKPMNLPPLTISGNPESGDTSVTSAVVMAASSAWASPGERLRPATPATAAALRARLACAVTPVVVLRMIPP